MPNTKLPKDDVTARGVYLRYYGCYRQQLAASARVLFGMMSLQPFLLSFFLNTRNAIRNCCFESAAALAKSSLWECYLLLLAYYAYCRYGCQMLQYFMPADCFCAENDGGDL